MRSMKILASAFSLGMLPQGGNVEIRPLTQNEFVWAATSLRTAKGFCPEGAVRPVSVTPDWQKAAIGHPGTVAALRKILGCGDLEVSREAISLEPGDVLLVAQPVGRQQVSGTEVVVPELGFFRVRVLVPPAPIEDKHCAQCGAGGLTRKRNGAWWCMSHFPDDAE